MSGKGETAGKDGQKLGDGEGASDRPGRTAGTGKQLSGDAGEFRKDADFLLDQTEHYLWRSLEGEAERAYDALVASLARLAGEARKRGLEPLNAGAQELISAISEWKKRGFSPRAHGAGFLRLVDACRALLVASGLPGSAASAASAEAPNALAPGAPLLAFVIDDEPDLVDLLSYILQGAGFKVSGFTSPLKAIEAIRETTPDVVLTDMRMPGMSGAEVVERVREIDANIPVIYVSGHLTKEMIVDGLSKGICGVVEKPFAEAHVISTVFAAARRHQRIDLLGHSLSLVISQFLDVDRVLQETGHFDVRDRARENLKSLLRARRSLLHAGDER